MNRLHLAHTVLAARWIGQQLFGCAFIFRQIAADVPDFEHFAVLECMARIGLDPLPEHQAFLVSTGLVMQAHAPVRGLSEDFVVFLMRA